jgi:hypothetical protein
MPSNHYAIPKKIAAIALKYGPNVSKGINEMEKVIELLTKEKEIERTKREKVATAILKRYGDIQ